MTHRNSRLVCGKQKEQLKLHLDVVLCLEPSSPSSNAEVALLVAVWPVSHCGE